MDAATTFLFHLGSVALAVPINLLALFFALMFYFLFAVCLVMLLLNMQWLTLRESVVVSLLLLVTTSGSWYLYWLVELT